MLRQIRDIKAGWVGVKLSHRQWKRFLSEDIGIISSLLFWESLNYPFFVAYSCLSVLEGLDDDEYEDFLAGII